MAEKKGICRNYVNCPLADKEEIQIVDDINFVCQHCHQPLEPADNNTGGKGGFDNKKKLLLKRIGIATVAIGLVVGGYFLFSSIIAKKDNWKSNNRRKNVSKIPSVEQKLCERQRRSVEKTPFV